MTFRGKRSRSNPENFEVEYLENGTRKRDVVRRNQIGSHIGTFEFYKFFQPQMTFRGQRSRSNPEFSKSNISKTVRDREMVPIEVK